MTISKTIWFLKTVALSGIIILAIIHRPLMAQTASNTDPSSTTDQTSAADRVDFSRDIRPLLSDACFTCHGPAEAARESELRLDTRAGAFVDLGDHRAIVPGDPDASSLYQRLTTDDEDERMPPTGSDKRLDADQVELVRRWIAQGADYSEHWAFEPPVKASLPVLTPDPRSVEGPTSVDWPRNEVDLFILERLQQEGFVPNRKAPRETLIRRVTFDLTGLPPSLQEINDFLSDTEPGAYERVVDRLLHSSHYGEHMARFWLDAARYGDTHGLHLDNYREIWPYRDWVINAFNANLPFDQFVIEQLAGDLLPNATLDQQIATGFNRCHVTTNEGGTIPEEFHVRNVIDRVDTTGQVFMGLTFGCAVCHEHKYDPISQTEYYQMFAFFNNIDGAPMDGNVKDHAPFVYVPTTEQTQAQNAIIAERKAIEDRHVARREQIGTAFDAWAAWQSELLASGSEIVLQSADPPGLSIHLPLDEKSGGTAADTIDEKKPATVAGQSKWIDGRRGGAIEFTGKDAYVTLGNVAAFRKADKFSIGAWIRTPGDVTGAAISKMDQARNTGYEVQIAGRRVAAILARSAPDLAMNVLTSNDVLTPGKWHHVLVTYDGSSRATGISIYVDGKQQPLDIRSDQLGTYDFNTGKPLQLGRRDQVLPFIGGAIDDVRIYDRRLSESEATQIAMTAEIEPLLAIAPDKRTPEQSQQLRTFYLTQYDSVFRKQTEAIQKKREDEAALKKTMTTSLVFRERSDVRQAFLLERGEYDRKRDPTERITPAIFPPMDPDMPRNRLGLARWLVSDQHPLTARVAVNRFWQQVFGTGIVKTAEDFGSQGEPPSHPKLLDWLAVDFRESGWNVRQLMKMLVMSASYRQSSIKGTQLFSRNGPEGASQKRAASPLMRPLMRDPDNRLLARGPRFRLDAEMLRDQALSVSGLLVPTIGGPSVKPPQPDGLWHAVGYSGSDTVRFQVDEGHDKVHRRTLYTFIKRTSPPPQLSTFDAPSREACTLRRERTNTPLQALLLLNDPQYFEAARALAERTLVEGGDADDSRLNHMLRLCTARTAAEPTLVELRGLLADQRKAYGDDVESARQMISVGVAPADKSLDPVELAAWTMVANVVLNMDEVVSKN
jgi:Protein of unknown function (DUF1553)/Protein of unknown function (DUF1549)/Concanavalin A-like lectin/glucanases superfamily/Planctomycete cytochrome C